MKQQTNFLKTTIAGGFFVLLPIVLIILVLAEVFGIVLGLVEPIADLFPETTVFCVCLNCSGILFTSVTDPVEL